ncbi:MAG: hypothetical protein HS101_08030 [Planctomycetia bacterium]|nr:hypothetical protein [Planctomycetia bacterium]
MKFTNKHRAARIGKVLARYKTGDTDADNLVDLLADARHWSDRNGQDFAELDRLAYDHYLSELDEERGGAL